MQIQIVFQPSPGAKAGCDIIIFCTAWIDVNFNPHPARKPGATRYAFANLKALPISTLTRLESRVRQDPMSLTLFDVGVSTLTRLESRVRPPNV